MSSCLWPRGLQHARLPCPSLSPRVCSNSCPLQRRQWHPTPVLLPGESHGRRSLVGYSPWGRKKLDTTERLHFRFQGCILSPCLLNLYAECIMRNAGWIKHKLESWLPERNSNNLRYTDDTTLMTENEEELKSLFMKIKEESEKVVLKHNILGLRSWPPVQSHHFMANRWGNNGNSEMLYFGGLQNHCRWWVQPWN